MGRGGGASQNSFLNRVFAGGAPLCVASSGQNEYTNSSTPGKTAYRMRITLALSHSVAIVQRAFISVARDCLGRLLLWDTERALDRH